MRVIFIILLLFFGMNSVFSQEKFKVISIDTIGQKYVIEIQKYHSKKTTRIFTDKTENINDNETRIKINHTYTLTLVDKYRIGSPELRFDVNGKEKFVYSKPVFRRNNKNSNYTAIELQGLYYLVNE